LHRFQGIVASRHSGLEGGDGSLRAGRRIGSGGAQHVLKSLLGFGHFGLHHLGEIGTGVGGDVIQSTVVIDGLFSQGLKHAGLQGQKLLGVFDA